MFHVVLVIVGLLLGILAELYVNKLRIDAHRKNDDIPR